MAARDNDFFSLREQMVQEQLATKGIGDHRVLEAVMAVPRELFVSEKQRHLAYADTPLGIDCDQTISQPYIVGLMTELLRLKGDERVLEIGPGSGYQTAILAKLAAEVYSVERYPELASKAGEVLDMLGLQNITITVGDGTRGRPEHAPYDGIIVTAAAPEEPKPLLEQLAGGGRLVIPIGGRHHQMLRLIERGKDDYHSRDVCGCRFVPLIGEYGWER